MHLTHGSANGSGKLREIYRRKYFATEKYQIAKLSNDFISRFLKASLSMPAGLIRGNPDLQKLWERKMSYMRIHNLFISTRVFVQPFQLSHLHSQPHTWNGCMLIQLLWSPACCMKWQRGMTASRMAIIFYCATQRIISISRGIYRYSLYCESFYIRSL